MLDTELLPSQPARFVFGDQLIDLRSASPPHPSQLLFVHAPTSALTCLTEQMGCSDAYAWIQHYSSRFRGYCQRASLSLSSRIGCHTSGIASPEGQRGSPDL